MASNLATSSRISLDEWDSLCTLSADEQSSVALLQRRASRKPVPSKLREREQSRPETPVPRSNRLNRLIDSPLNEAGSRPLSVNSNHRAVPGDLSLELRDPIETNEQFYDWFAKVEQSLEREQENDVRLLLDEYDRHVGTCDRILEDLDESRGLLSEMEANYRHVDENSRSLQLACETMLDEQKHLQDVTEAIEARLRSFRELDAATKMLSLPGESIVLQEDFLNMLDRLDACLEFLKANRDFKDSEIFIIRFQQCLTRAMTLIRMYSISTIRRLASKAVEKSSGKELSEAASNALFYGTFSDAAETLRILVSELEKRAAIDAQEYGTLLQEVLSAWFAARSSVISPQLAIEVKRMEPASSDVIKLAHAGCNHLRTICIQEHALFKKLFNSGEQAFYSFLEGLCDRLYDSLRPRILHESNLETLCELCTILNAMMALDRQQALDVDSDSENEDDDEVPPTPRLNGGSNSRFLEQASKVGTNGSSGGVGPLKFSLLLQPILQDAQTRLVFRAEAILQSEVVRFSPSPADLDYPAKLEKSDEQGLKLWTEDEQLQDADAAGKGGIAVANEKAQATWYPTLKRTQYLLSKLHTYVNNAIFEDFAGEAVTLCRQSLAHAYSLVRAARAKQDSANSTTTVTDVDAHLFLIRHLVLLKEMVRSVDLTKVERLPDLRPVADAFVQLLSTSVLFNPNALFKLASQVVPVFTETMTDAKSDLDQNLKVACESFIRDTSSGITHRLASFLDECSSYLAAAAAASASASPSVGAAPNNNAAAAARDLAQQPFAGSQRVLELDAEFHKTSIEECRRVLSKLELYLKDPKTIGVLVPPLLEEVMDVYVTFYNLVRAEYDFATSSTLALPESLKEELSVALGMSSSAM